MAGQESGVFGSTPDEWNALGDAQTRWREVATGVGGGDGASNPQPVPDVLSGFIISGGRGFGQDDSGDSFGGLVPAEDAHYYLGYWAGVQAALYLHPAVNPFIYFGLAPPVSPFGAHSYGFATDVLQALQQPPTQDLNARVAAAARNIGSVSQPLDLRLTPEPAPWSFGNNADEWPADLPDWGDRPSGPTLPGFSPIKGKWSDVSPFPQYFSPGQLQQYQDVNPELAPDANPDDFSPFMVETFREATGQVSAPIGIDPFTGTADADITPGNTTSDVTPRGDWID